MPQTATLNALVAILDFGNWQEFKQAKTNKRPNNRKRKIWFVSAALASVLLVSTLFLRTKPHDNSYKPVVKGEVQFTTKKTRIKGLPNSVIFSYDVSKVEADSFFFQQSWNMHHRRQINPKGDAISTIYYESGFHKAHLVADGSSIAMQPIHILSDGWEPHIYYDQNDLIPIDFSKEKVVENGMLHIDQSLFEKLQVDQSRFYFTRIVNSQEFNVPSDNFRFETRLKLDSLKYSDCPWMSIVVVTEEDMFMIALKNKGCEHYAYYKLGEIQRGGNDNDLSKLGCNIYQWQDVALDVRNKKATLSINGEECYSEQFTQDFGDIVSLVYMFERTGSIDYAKLSSQKGEVALEDSFE